MKERKQRGQRGLMIVAAEGAMAQNESMSVAFEVEGSPQKERYGGFSQNLCRYLEKELDWEARNVVLGHLQRSRHPSVTDRFLTLSMGVQVAALVQQDKWGTAAVYRNGLVQEAPLADLMKPARLVDTDHRWVKMAESLGIFI